MKKTNKFKTAINNKYDSFRLWTQNITFLSFILIYICLATFPNEIFKPVGELIFITHDFSEGQESAPTKFVFIDSTWQSSELSVKEHAKHYIAQRQWLFFLIDLFFILFYIFTTIVVSTAIQRIFTKFKPKYHKPMLMKFIHYAPILMLFVGTVDFTENILIMFFLHNQDITLLAWAVAIITNTKIVLFYLVATPILLIYLRAIFLELQERALSIKDQNVNDEEMSLISK